MVEVIFCACKTAKLTVHRDLKDSNLLLSADQWELKIADVGLARRLQTIDEEVSHARK